MFRSRFQKISQSPTNPQAEPTARRFDVADLYEGPASRPDAGSAAAVGLDEKLRQAYFWIVNTAIISPFYDIEYETGPSPRYSFGDSAVRVTLPSGQSYSSFVLLPLLNLVVRKRCLIVGGPGRGKTATAILMGVLAGYALRDIKRAIQHGQPQMTIADLLGNPLPADLVGAESMDNIRIAWRKWLGMRVKVIDEYNRIPTRTQSALLTVMADNYAELLDQIYECPEAAWYLTANDDAGGGTYPVIEALQDRIDIVVRALHFNTRFVGDLLQRIEHKFRPETMVPPEIVFQEGELDRISDQILEVVIPPQIRRRVEFFCSHFEFCEPAATQLEYMTKDTVKLSGIDFHQVVRQDTGKDKLKDLGSQTRNGVSVRTLLTLFVFVKAMAYFRGCSEATLDDVRQLLPFVLHDRLDPHLSSPFFDQPETQALRVDRLSWLRHLFDLSCGEYDRLDLDRDDPVARLEREFERGLDGLNERQARAQLVEIERVLADWSSSRKIYGHIYDDVLKLKYLHQRYTNYLRWRQWQG